MEALEYIKKFKMDQPNYQFKRQKFIDELGKEFRAVIYDPNLGYDKASNTLSFDRFTEVVKEFNDKFLDISLKRGELVGEFLTKGLWNAFYAQNVCKVREELYPKEAKRILVIKAKREKNNTLCQRRQDKKEKANKSWAK